MDCVHIPVKSGECGDHTDAHTTNPEGVAHAGSGLLRQVADTHDAEHRRDKV